MIGLVNIVRTCCHACVPTRRGSGILGALAVFALVIAVCVAGKAALGAVGSGASVLEAANRAVEAGIAIVVKVAVTLVALVALGVGGRAALEWWQGRRAVEAFEAHNRRLDEQLEQRRAAALEANRARAATAATPRQRVTSRRTDRATADEVLEVPADRAPVDLDAVIRDGGW